MRLLLVLIVMLVIGLLVTGQLADNKDSAVDKVAVPQVEGVPQVPRTVDQLPEFKQQINSFVQKEQAEQKERLERLSQ